MREAIARQAAVVLLGPRQVGKTTLALKLAEEVPSLYLDLEATDDRRKLADPALFLRQYEDRLVVLDEIHRVPELFRTLRGLIDQGWEGFVIENLIAAAPDRTVASFYRTSAGAEIDLVLDIPGRGLWVIDIKRGCRPGPRRVSTLPAGI